MSNWIWDGGWKASTVNADGTVTVLSFTSSAQARQHVEKHHGTSLAKRVRKHVPKRRHNRVSGKHEPITKLSEEQRQLKQAAMKQLEFKK